MIAVVDYGLGNLRSVQKAFEYTGYKCFISNDPEMLNKAAGLVLPGVGAFGKAMENLRGRKLDVFLEAWIASGRPFLGICLGFQMLFEYSEEGGPGCRGFGIIPGCVKRFPETKGMKVPQIGWNSISIKNGSKLLKGLKDGEFVYFVHSFFANAENRENVTATTEYTVSYDSAAEKGNVFGTQFHPEKSGDAGLCIIRNFGNIAGRGNEDRT